MANVQFTHHVGHVGFDNAAAAAGPEAVPLPNVLKRYTNLVGAVLSVSLVCGVGFWGYKLIVRDVTGIPVVEAATGSMREEPKDPGGQLALHQGLAVNEVAAEGEAAGPAERLVLAPRPKDLMPEDQPMAVETAAQAQQPAAPIEAPEPVDPGIDVAAALEAGDVDAVVAELTQGIGAIEASPLAEDVSPDVVAEVTPVARPASFDTSGMRVSLRPQLRPVAAVASTAPAAVTPVAARATSDIDPDSIPVGTRLVQLGALDTPENARAHWDRLAARFGQYLDGKERVIQRASSGGRAFYRLRAMGFADLAEARRFCAALSAEGADCIPVVVR